MGYPRSLDEYDDDELIRELANRRNARQAGKCDYCSSPSKDPAKCGSGRHTATAESLRIELRNAGFV